MKAEAASGQAGPEQHSECNVLVHWLRVQKLCEMGGDSRRHVYKGHLSFLIPQAGLHLPSELDAWKTYTTLVRYHLYTLCSPRYDLVFPCSSWLLTYLVFWLDLHSFTCRLVPLHSGTGCPYPRRLGSFFPIQSRIWLHPCHSWDPSQSPP